MTVNIVETIDDHVPIRHALVSVSDKQHIDRMIEELIDIVPELMILSTGGTYETLKAVLREKASRHLLQVSAYTGQPETQGGLVKTLDFKIYLGILTETYNQAHQQDLIRTGAVPIDLVVVNLYPFAKVTAREGVTLEEARANIDIGGPCMVRAAAKNFHRVAVLVDPSDYLPFVRSLRVQNGCTRLHQRFELAKKAFRHTAEYDAAITKYLSNVSFDRELSCYHIQ